MINFSKQWKLIFKILRNGEKFIPLTVKKANLTVKATTPLRASLLSFDRPISMWILWSRDGGMAGSRAGYGLCELSLDVQTTGTMPLFL